MSALSRRFLGLVVLLIFLVAFTIPSYAKVTINVWQPWGGDLGKWMEQLGSRV